MKSLAITTPSCSYTPSLPTPGFPPSYCHPPHPQGSCPSLAPSPSCPFAGLPIRWPPPLPAFVAAFVLTPTLWGLAALLPSCSVSSSSLPCAGASLSRAAQPHQGHTGDGLLTPMSGTPKSSCPHPGVAARSIVHKSSPALCICALGLSVGTMNNEKLRGNGTWPAQMRLSDRSAARL